MNQTQHMCLPFLSRRRQSGRQNLRMDGLNLQSVPTVRSEFQQCAPAAGARCAQANRRWPCLQKLRGTLIRGAETCKSIFREGFNMESLEEVLISLGIGGMTSQFAQILQSAFRLADGSSLCSKEIINGPDVLDAFQSVSERKIRSLFKAAVEDEKKFGKDVMGMEEMFLRQLSSTNSTEVLHMQQEIARLKEDTAHFQATLASYEEDKAKLEKKFARYGKRQFAVQLAVWSWSEFEVVVQAV